MAFGIFDWNGGDKQKIHSIAPGLRSPLVVALLHHSEEYWVSLLTQEG
jgi:hypothetical protein